MRKSVWVSNCCVYIFNYIPQQMHSNPAIMFVPNGFRTVEQENALMEQMLDERRRRAAKEEGISPDAARTATTKQTATTIPKSTRVRNKNKSGK